MSCTRSDLCVQGCTADKAFIPFKIKWNDIVMGGWTAPGGNRYWKTTIPADPRDPRVWTVLSMLAGRSAFKFVEIWGKVTKKTMADVMAAGAWVTRVGLMSVPIMPIATETPAAFVARGGFLLDMRPAFSPILNGVAWQKQGATIYPWLADTDVRTVELWGNYDAASSQLNYTVRVVYNGKWDSTVNSVDKSIESAMQSFCSQLTQKAGYAAAAATAVPALAPYMAVYTAALAVCNIAMAQVPPIPCIPREPRPDDLMVAVATTRIQISPGTGTQTPTGGGLRPPAAQVPGITATITANTINPNTYPAGTLAWQNTGGAGYDVAIPNPGGATTHRVTQYGLSSPPLAARVVDRSEWEKAVLPWTQRTPTKIGFGVAAAAAAATAAIVALKLKH